MPEPDVLPYSTCRDLLASGVFGRVGLVTEDGPVILPVNYAVVSESILVATAVESTLARYAPGARVAFEVDHVDYARHLGWSVLATGEGSVVADPDEVDRIRRTWEPRPWASGERPVLVRLAWTELSGRRLGQGWSWDELTPVRRSVPEW